MIVYGNTFVMYDKVTLFMKGIIRLNLLYSCPSPLLEVYSKAAWKQQVFVSSVSSMDICIPKPASGFILGSDSRSVDLTKKFP